MSFVSGMDRCKSFVGSRVEYVAFDLNYNVALTFFDNGSVKVQSCDFKDFKGEPTIVVPTYYKKKSSNRPWVIFPDNKDNTQRLIEKLITDNESSIVSRTERKDTDGDNRAVHQSYIDDSNLEIADLKRILVSMR